MTAFMRGTSDLRKTDNLRKIRFTGILVGLPEPELNFSPQSKEVEGYFGASRG